MLWLLAGVGPLGIAQQPEPASAAPASARERALGILDREQCQTALPHSSQGTGAGRAGPARDRDHGRRLVPADRPPPERQLALPRIFGLPFATIVFWTFLVLVVVGLVAFAVNAVRERSGQPPKLPTPVRGTSATAGAAGAPPPDAASLAGAGRFAEAIAALLQQALRQLAEAGVAVRESTTAREALRAAAAAGAMPGLPALRALVVRAEIARFSGRPVARPEFDDAEAAFGQWRAACPPPR